MSRNPTRILGVSAYYHDSAAALIQDGEIVAAAQEERFSRTKHDNGLPVRAIKYCLSQAGIGPEDLDYVTFYEKPLLRFDRLVETYLAFCPEGFKSFVAAMPSWLSEKLYAGVNLTKALKSYNKGVLYVPHHEAHAGSAFYPSPFDEAAIITIDGVGEWATTAIWVGDGNNISLLKEIHFPHSLGLIYSAFTSYLGFRVNDGEYKVMGLSPYGRPVYVDRIMDNLITLYEDGSFHLDQKFFNYCQGLTSTSAAFHDLFERPPRHPDSAITQREMDIAASIQCVTNEVILRIATNARELTGKSHLCMAGGVALNCVANGLVHSMKIFDDLWIQPAAGDAGGALGAALCTWYRFLDSPREAPVRCGDMQQGSLLGPSYSDEAIRSYLDSVQAIYRDLEDDESLCAAAATALEAGRIVGWFQGRMEFGPRALGNRSILADARDAGMQRKLNLKIKYRESFRPFAPIVLEELVGDYFGCDTPSPYMLLVAPVLEQHRIPLTAQERSLSGLATLDLARSVIPAVTHVDYSARLQTVDKQRHAFLHRLLSTFHRKTGMPVLVNTSFNVKDEPIVCSPHDALNCFLRTEMDDLFMGHFHLIKAEQRTAMMSRKGPLVFYQEIPIQQ